MTKKIFRGILFSSFITMLASMVFIIGVQYRIYDDSQRDSLESKARLISFAADDGEIERYADAKERVTLIKSDGTVIYDNKSDAEKMENHAQREEVREAERENGKPRAARGGPRGGDDRQRLRCKTVGNTRDKHMLLRFKARKRQYPACVGHEPFGHRGNP